MNPPLDTAAHPAVLRRPSVAGYYYPADPDDLRAEAAALTAGQPPPVPAVAVMIPHGSWRAAGSIMGATLSRVIIPRVCVIIGASHTRRGTRWSIMRRGAYGTPLGEVPIEEALAERLSLQCPFLIEDREAQRGEHAVEVALPLLQCLGPEDLAIVPIITDSEDGDEHASVSAALAQTARSAEEPVLLVASSDLSHDEPAGRGAEQDRRVLEAICALDRAAFDRTIRDQAIRMCGFGAVSCLLGAARLLDATQATLVAYGTTAEAGGDPQSAIGFAGLLIHGETRWTNR